MLIERVERAVVLVVRMSSAFIACGVIVAMIELMVQTVHITVREAVQNVASNQASHRCGCRLRVQE